MWEKNLKRFISQQCIGYTERFESVIKCDVEYADSSRKILYMVSGHDGRQSPLVEWEKVPPITVWQSEVG